jgi:hypothetical protein
MYIDFSFQHLRTLMIWLATAFTVATFASAQQTQRKQAEVTIRRSIQAMGGDAWTMYGAATTRVTETGSMLPTAQSTWSDDWTRPGVRSRREIQLDGGSSMVEVSGDGFHHVKTPAQSRPLPAEFDLERLLLPYPEVVLRAALSRPDCSFRVLEDTRSVPSDEVGDVEMTCKTPTSANGQKRVVWRFSPDGLPVRVRVFAANPQLSTQRFKTIEYNGFEVVQGLTVPASVDVINGAKRRHFGFSSQAFVASLPSSQFPTEQN